MIAIPNIGGKIAMGNTSRKVIVTRHTPTLDWIRSQGHADAKHVPHLTMEEIATLNAGDMVLGTLPLQLAAKLGQRGALYFGVEMDVNESDRGKEIDDVSRRSPRLVRYSVLEIPHQDSANLKTEFPEQKSDLWNMISAITLALAMLFSGSFATQLLGDLVFKPETSLSFNLIVGLLYFSAFVGCVYTAQAFGLKFLSIRTMTRVDHIEPRSILITGISQLPTPQSGDGERAAEKAADAFIECIKTYKLTLPEVGAKSSDFINILISKSVPEKEAQTLNQFRWLPNLVTINKLHEKLTSIVIVPSSSTQSLVPLFKKMVLEVYANSGRKPPNFEVRPAADYTQFDDANVAMTSAVRQNLPTDEVCVDVTPGTAIFAIGAAVSTLDNDATFVHVSMDRRIRQFQAKIAVAQSVR